MALPALTRPLVVVPDMPGFGHSDRPAGAPLDSIAVAGLWAELMTAVGYRRFGVAGGDIGSSVSRYLALDCGGDLVRSFTQDEICALLTRYWLIGTIGSSMRMYAANAAIPPEQHARRVEVPSGFALFPGDTLHPPRARELRAFFRPYRGGDGG